MAKRSRRKARLAPRPVPVTTDIAIERLREYCRDRFGALPCPITHVARARMLDNEGFAVDVQLFDGGRAILIVRYMGERGTEERWCMRGKYKPEGPRGFYWDPVQRVWVRATEEEAKAATAAGHCL